MARLAPINFGPVRIETPVILAPMTGVTDMPFRRIVKRYGAGLTVSEMIASQAAIRETRQSLQRGSPRRRDNRNPGRHPRAPPVAAEDGLGSDRGTGFDAARRMRAEGN